jgi:response regulator RpfG family c-di-GMP phosphodiesterase
MPGRLPTCASRRCPIRRLPLLISALTCAQRGGPDEQGQRAAGAVAAGRRLGVSAHGAASALALRANLAEAFQHARILIVDDRPENVVLLRRVLSKAGYHDVHSTSEPSQAEKLFQAYRPDLVLLDLHMPEMDGFAVLERLRSLTARSTYLPILVLTGDHDPLKRRQALAAGATDFLAKPFDIVEVVLRIRNLLETRHLHRLLSNQNAVLEAGVRQRTRELEEAQGEILARLAAAAEHRDDDTGRHIFRVGHMSAAIAESLGLASEAVELIRGAAPLHDVGKIGVPDHILLKVGKLNRVMGEIRAQDGHHFDPAVVAAFLKQSTPKGLSD